MPYGQVHQMSLNAPNGAAPGGREHLGAWWHKPPHWALHGLFLVFLPRILGKKTDFDVAIAVNGFNFNQSVVDSQGRFFTETGVMGQPYCLASLFSVWTLAEFRHMARSRPTSRRFSCP